jgi:REP element-mobilizing transposase RayT
MPSRNIIRQDSDNLYYHVYARGASHGLIFLEPDDKDYFLYLIARHLSIDPVISKNKYQYPHLRPKIELLTYCLMDNHFHMLLYQIEKGGMTLLMRSIMTAYSAYFNRKYDRTGSLFESRFKSALVYSDTHLLHVSRYIHLNPRGWKYFSYSSINYYRNANEPKWLQTQRVLQHHSSRSEYLKFVGDYEDSKRVLDDLKHALAGI